MENVRPPRAIPMSQALSRDLRQAIAARLCSGCKAGVPVNLQGRHSDIISYRCQAEYKADVLTADAIEILKRYHLVEV